MQTWMIAFHSYHGGYLDQAETTYLDEHCKTTFTFLNRWASYQILDTSDESTGEIHLEIKTIGILSGVNENSKRELQLLTVILRWQKTCVRTSVKRSLTHQFCSSLRDFETDRWRPATIQGHRQRWRNCRFDSNGISSHLEQQQFHWSAWHHAVDFRSNGEALSDIRVRWLPSLSPHRRLFARSRQCITKLCNRQTQPGRSLRPLWRAWRPQGPVG